MTREHLAYAFLTTFICGFGSGVIAYDFMLEREKAKQALAPIKKVINAQPAALQLSCNRRGIEEWYRVCRARARMEAVR